jgi:hypothetical protein
MRSVTTSRRSRGSALWTETTVLRLPAGGTMAGLRVEDLPEQGIKIVFGPARPDVPRVYASTPASSPHRYLDDSLCMWFPGDPPEQRWTHHDGPMALLGHIVAHLLREKWWRQTGEWPGQEAPHNQAEILSAESEPEIAA